MPDAIRTLLLVLAGYAVGALHLWFVGKITEGRAYLRGKMDGFEEARRRRVA